MHASQTLSQSGAFMQSRQEEAGHVAAAAVRGPLKETNTEMPIAARSSGTLSRASDA
jgi:hypothetical protein